MMRLLCFIALLWAAPTFSEDNVLNSLSQSDDSHSSNATHVQDIVESSASTPVVDIGETESEETNDGTTEQKAMPSQPNAKQESIKTKSSPNYEDEQTYLDLFGDRAKELLTQHIIPTTDASCRWDWRMGRCEPYCECGYFYLWGDYHFGRSCRLRSKFMPVKSARSSLQDAWQQWADHMDDPDAFASFVDSGNKAKKPKNAACSLPPESRYTQAAYYVTKLLGRGTLVLHQFQKVRNHVVELASRALSHGKGKFDEGRQNACDELKKIIEERERERNQTVILTRRGMIWIRRICGTKNQTVANTSIDDEQQEEYNECRDAECA